MLSIFVLQSCSTLEPKTVKEKDYYAFSGKITNNTEDSITFSTSHGDKAIVKINADGTFSGTLKITEPGELVFTYGKARYWTFARNGYDIHITWDAKKIPGQRWEGENIQKTIKFTGYGSDVINYYIYSQRNRSDFEENRDRYKLSRSDFKQQLEASIAAKINNAPKDPVFIEYYKKMYDPKPEWEEYERVQSLANLIGKESPKFTGYENYDGSKTSLDDFKGQYIYIDIWATWCRPCVNEIPNVKALEEKYHGKNIVFVSISIDEDKNAWKAKVEKEKMTGVQLLAGSEQNSFMEGYNMKGIPRFILIDPDGKIVSADAPRPSESKATEALFNSLDL